MTMSRNLLVAAIALGAVTGMRSMLAPTLTSRALVARDDIDQAGDPARLLASAGTRRALLPLAAGELLGDKLPFAPDRTMAPSMVFRALSGGMTAAALAGARRESVLVPAVIGAVTACVSAKIALDLRKRYGSANGWSNAALGLAEDALALTVAKAGLKRALHDRH